MADWTNDKVFGRFTFRDLFTFIPNPDASDARLPLEKELSVIFKEIRDKDPKELKEMLERYSAFISDARSLKNPYYEERRGLLIAGYMRKVVKEIESRLYKMA